MGVSGSDLGREGGNIAYGEFVADLCVGLELPVVWTTPMTSYKSTMLVLHRVVVRCIGVDDTP